MDGGGRFARSVRQSEPQTNPDRQNKAASKARQSRVRAPAHAVPKFDISDRNSKIAKLERWLPNGIGVAAAMALMLSAGVLGVIKGGTWNNVNDALDDMRNAAANAVGFKIASVGITGRKQLSPDDVLVAGGVTGRSSLLFLDAAAVREKLKADPWIAEATVQKLYPGELRIEITERVPFALWQHDGRLSVIAENGTVLQPFMAQRFAGLPLVVGAGAEMRAKEFLEILARFPQLRAAVKAAVFVGERRWNLRTADGLDVRLPENDPGAALAMLSKLDREENLLSRDITAIDMRLPDRLVVQLSEDAAKARDEALKDKKTKRKAGDA